jgi:hypothetical protein
MVVRTRWIAVVGAAALVGSMSRRAGWCLVVAAVLATGCGTVPPTSQVASTSRTSSPTPAKVACANAARPLAPNSGVVYLNTRNAILLFGGDWTTQTRAAETWLRSSGCWTKLSPVASPSLRDSMTMAYDPVQGVVVMYGGRVGGPGEAGKFLFDTWTWDGQTWAAAASAAGPEMKNPAAAYDPISKRVILFGASESVASEKGEPQTWTWTGQGWQLLRPTVSPSARYGAGLAFDSATGQLLLFGGARTDRGPLDETWTWNGSTWRQIVPASSPSPRHSPAMGNGSARGLVLFGGADFSHWYTDTWIWDGRSWNQASPSHTPPSGVRAGVATDAGLELIGKNGDVWDWSGSDWVRLA